jgi:hypothetical protein
LEQCPNNGVLKFIHQKNEQTLIYSPIQPRKESVFQSFAYPLHTWRSFNLYPFMTYEEITSLYDLGNLSQFEFIDLLEKRWVVLDRKIKSCTSGDSSWNDFQLWKSELHEIDDLLQKIA